MITIKNRWTGEAIFTSQTAATVLEALKEAIKGGSNLSDSDLRGSNLRDSNLRGSDLRGSNLSYSDLRDSKNLPDSIAIKNLDSKILECIENGKGKLDMSAWHTCETTHCRAGWAITLAGDVGRDLEEKLGPSTAGALIYFKSTGRVPDFLASNDEAIRDMKEQAAKEAK